jgi:hypothetical protein
MIARGAFEDAGGHGGARGGWWEVKALASFIPCSSGVPHRADIAHKALIVTAGFPKYEALRSFRCVPQWVVGQGNASAGLYAFDVVLSRERRLRTRAATPWRGPTDDAMR